MCKRPQRAHNRREHTITAALRVLNRHRARLGRCEAREDHDMHASAAAQQRVDVRIRRSRACSPSHPAGSGSGTVGTSRASRATVPARNLPTLPRQAALPCALRPPQRCANCSPPPFIFSRCFCPARWAAWAAWAARPETARQERSGATSDNIHSLRSEGWRGWRSPWANDRGPSLPGAAGALPSSLFLLFNLQCNFVFGRGSLRRGWALVAERYRSDRRADYHHTC